MIGLFKAIHSFDPEGGAAFRTFADLCINRQILTAIKTASRRKHEPLNESVSLNEPVAVTGAAQNEGGVTLQEIIRGNREMEPEEELMLKTLLEEISSNENNVFSSLEMEVWNLYSQGCNYREIADILDRSPKTVDNDLQHTDHCPGFASAAKFIANTALATWLDVNVYTRQEVFILETMGRDAGWLAASACLSGIVDLVILPEVAFDKELFLNEVKRCVEEKNKCYVVVSEGCKYTDGTYIAAGEAKNDGFGHAVLGGAAHALKNMILESGVASRCKVQDLSTAQRCYVTSQSKVDVEESFSLGMSAHMRSCDKTFTGKMVGLKRKDQETYDVDFFAIDADQVANFVKSFPSEWILENYRGITEDALAYLRPLVVGSPVIVYKNGLPAYVKPYYMK